MFGIFANDHHPAMPLDDATFGASFLDGCRDTHSLFPIAFERRKIISVECPTVQSAFSDFSALLASAGQASWGVPTK
jgi:hypothetical protein